MNNYKNPKIFADLLIIYKLCLATHNNKSKIFRITVHEKMLNEIVECMKLIVLANTRKNNKKDIESAINDLRIELLASCTFFDFFAYLRYSEEKYNESFV